MWVASCPSIVKSWFGGIGFGRLWRPDSQNKNYVMGSRRRTFCGIEGNGGPFGITDDVGDLGEK